ncbi:hypothetical protein [Vibrio renipiscarius]|uniref:KfrA N-terminal DNA-binding domain-containing protein n=1 Tax=Vibrio renipiscarius TaxID=1461322 RepID=A0A0C2NB23_9VIBR|nr:hypothetical protein [Vibrio renipiscarius]KII76836.1 hypothetical protein PL18_16945 [Vibrio renipiscarius]KII76965.1 hypothetical protein OJ16_12645 [Vibrio renipiscarius]
MLTKDISLELEQVITALIAEGKEPTVALVKSRLKTSVPIPALIGTIKSWKSSNRIPKIEVAAAPQSEDSRITQLEAQILDLQSRLSALEAKLAQ